MPEPLGPRKRVHSWAAGPYTKPEKTRQNAKQRKAGVFMETSAREGATIGVYCAALGEERRKAEPEAYATCNLSVAYASGSASAVQADRRRNVTAMIWR